jgi:hypothetical protein
LTRNRAAFDCLNFGKSAVFGGGKTSKTALFVVRLKRLIFERQTMRRSRRRAERATYFLTGRRSVFVSDF